MKECKKCHKQKAVDEYYVYNKYGKRMAKCKDCIRAAVTNRYKEKIKDPIFHQKEKDRGVEKYNRLGYADKYKPSAEQKGLTIKRHLEKYPEKRLATNSASRLKRNPGNELHHWSYNREHHKDVIELSRKDHATAHRFLTYDQPMKMYRDVSGRLLDSREMHELYIMDRIHNNQLNITSKKAA